MLCFAIVCGLVPSLAIADSGNNRIRMVSSDGNIVTVAGGGRSGASGDEYAQWHLGLAFMRGSGEEQNDVAALVWFGLA